MDKPNFNQYLHALPNPENITRNQLPNGITVLSRSNFHSSTLSIKGYLHGGSLADPEEKLGLSSLTAFGLMSGTVNHNFQSLHNQIESIGANIGFSSSALRISFSAHCLSEDLDLILSLISECLRFPLFPEKEFNRQKNQVLTALAIRAQDTGAMAGMLFDKILYRGHPYQHPEEGYTETIQSISREDLVDFHHRIYGPKNMVLTIVGAVEAEKALESAAQHFGDWTNPHYQEPPTIESIKPLEKWTEKRHSIPGKTQADLVMGSLAPDRHSPDYHALRIGNNILGEFGMMGRLGQRVREEAGLAYYVYSSLSISLGPGAWEMIAGVNPSNVDQTIALITDEVRNFVSQPVTAEELSDSKSFYLGRMPFLIESNSGVAVSLLNIEHFNLGLDYFLQYPKLVQAITREDIFEASRKYLDPNCLAVAVAGP